MKRHIADMEGRNELEPGGKLYLRVRVQGGGCSGFQNKLDLDPKYDEKTDHKFEFHGIEVVIDKRSMLYLEGAVVDFHDDLEQSRGFTISNPQAKSTCGCGSFPTAYMSRGRAMSDDYFDRLGLPRRFVLVAGALERAYLARSRAIHPDFHLAGSSADLDASMELSAALNEAYNILRDPFARAEHLLAAARRPNCERTQAASPSFPRGDARRPRRDRASSREARGIRTVGPGVYDALRRLDERSRWAVPTARSTPARRRGTRGTCFCVCGVC